MEVDAVKTSAVDESEAVSRSASLKTPPRTVKEGAVEKTADDRVEQDFDWLCLLRCFTWPLVVLVDISWADTTSASWKTMNALISI